MHEIKSLEPVLRPLFYHRNLSGFKSLEKNSNSYFLQFSTYCDPYRRAGNCDRLRSAGLAQKLNFSFGLSWFLTFLKFSTYCNPCKFTGNCDSCRIPGLMQKRSFSVGERRNLKFLQYSMACDPCRVRLGCLRGDCVVDLNAEDSCIPSNMLDFLRNGAIGSVKS